MAAIEVQQLKKYYGKTRGIEDVTFTVEDGEIFGFVGPNGAGKSTTIRTLLNFVFPTAGRASVLGFDAVRQSKQVRAAVGYLPAEVGYYEDMSVKALLEFSGGFYGLDPAAMRGRISELADRFELDVSRRARSLSTGNRKKVGICLALLHSPRLLILDEPTSGLDPLMQRRLLELLQAENRRGVTVFFSSHVLSEVERLCHRVAILKDGRVIRIEDVGSRRSVALVKVRAVFAHGAAAGPLSIPGVLKQQAGELGLELLYGGEIDDLVRELGRHHLASLTLEEPPLEEVFMHYYQTGGTR